MNESLGHIILDSLLGFFVEHQYEELGLLVELLVLLNVVELSH